MVQINEVIVYRTMMYANPLLIVHATYSNDQSVYYSARGWFLKIFKWIAVNVTIKIHYSFIDVLLQSFTEQYSSLINGSEKTEQNSRNKTSQYTCTTKTYCIFDLCTVWIGHSLRSSPLVSIHEERILISKYTNNESCSACIF